MAESSNETPVPRSAVKTSLRIAFMEFLKKSNEHKLFKLTQFYRDRLEQAIEEEVKSIALLLKEQQQISKQELLKVEEERNKAHSSKLLVTLVMEKGSVPRRVMWESILKTKYRFPKLENMLTDILSMGTDIQDLMKLIRGCTEIPSHLKGVQQKHKEKLCKQTEKLRMNKIGENDGVKDFQLDDRYADLTVISGKRKRKHVEHELLSRDQEHEAWHENQAERIPTDKLFWSSFVQGKRSVAVSGDPGIGKTTMVQKIVHDWATEKIYQNFQFVFSFKFRELNDTNCKINLRELILDQYPYFGSILQEIWKHPELLLFIFDGLDEYKVKIDFADNRRNTEPKHKCDDPETWCEVSDIVYALIQRKLLPGCSVLLTSRPTTLYLLERAEIDLWAEIRGFAHAERKQYFNRFFERQAVAAAVFKHVKENKILYSMSFNPSYCWILGQTLGPFFINSVKLQQIPQTITELYSYHIYNILENHSNVQKPRDTLLKIGELAFAGVSERKIMFRTGDLIMHQLQPSQFVSGFLMELFDSDDSVPNIVYEFTHLTVQEFIAALAQFLNAGPGDIREFFEEARKVEDGRYDLFLRFLVGLSSRKRQPLEKYLGPFPIEVTYQVIDWIKVEIQKRIANTWTKAGKTSLLNMFHYLFECQNKPLVESTVGSVKTLKFNGLQMNPIDCAVLSNVIGFCDTMNDIDLQNCSIQCDGLRWLESGLHKCRVLRLWNNKLGDSGVELLSVALREPTCKIEELQLGANNLTASCATDLASALSENQSLLELDLTENKLGDSGIQNLCVVLRNPACKIKKLSMKANGLTAACIKDLSSALSINQSLTTLSLGSNPLGDAGVRQLPKGLCRMEELELDDTSLSACCTEDLASAVSTYQSLRALNLSKNDLGDSGIKIVSAALRTSNQQLEELRLWEVGLTASCARDVASVMISISSSLMFLELGGNKLGDRGMKILCEAMKRNQYPQLKQLRFWKNELTDSCVSDLYSALRAIRSVWMLNLKSNNFTDQSVQTFRNLVQDCRGLRNLDLDDNKFSSNGRERLLSLQGYRNGMKVFV
ncbi:NACHT, LRR and PYD domains-containing protein 3-like [Leucoraja erinacea]|uniref:NACHT, LRR and PYD domains-containing protein 3-like n=1 Tax=Leucoraja erinaceus TaxID=7782 RepID=UPI0024555CFC|nr:NACHT, LRR and PYD domains-containing protein 3-like [Leucoraja erinacea]XP_055510694.1 NACHT, LRR and PYD domains-containing protein 3-like [Leucoraja erinacea]